MQRLLREQDDLRGWRSGGRLRILSALGRFRLFLHLAGLPVALRPGLVLPPEFPAHCLTSRRPPDRVAAGDSPIASRSTCNVQKSPRAGAWRLSHPGGRAHQKYRSEFSCCGSHEIQVKLSCGKVNFLECWAHTCVSIDGTLCPKYEILRSGILTLALPGFAGRVPAQSEIPVRSVLSSQAVTSQARASAAAKAGTDTAIITPCVQEPLPARIGTTNRP